MEVPAAVVEFDRELKRRLLDTLDLASELRGSCQEAVGIIRAHSGGDAAFGIETAFIKSAGDAELCRLYTSRAVHFFEFAIAVLSELSLANQDTMEEDAFQGEVDRIGRRLFARFWPERSLPIDLDPDSDAVADELFPPISTRDDLASYARLLEGYRPLATHGIPWKTRVLEENEQYFEHAFRSSLKRDLSPDLPRQVFGAVYLSRLLNMQLYIGERDGSLKLIYIFPYSP